MARFFIPFVGLISGEYRRRAAVGSGAPAVTYLLRASWAVGDQGFVNDQVLGATEGVEVGQLTVKEAGLSVAEIVSNKLQLTGDSSLSQPSVISPGFTGQIGLGFLADINTSNGTGPYFIWADGSPPVEVTGWHIQTEIQNGINLNARFKGSDAGTATISIGITTVNTDYKQVLLIGGYNVTNVPYKAGDTKANFDFGGAIFIEGGSEYPTYTLLYRTPGDAAGTMFAFNNMFSANAATADNHRVPDPTTALGDLSSQLEPLAMDTFTDTNGTSLDAHTMDLGTGWTEQTGNWDIQSNQANRVTGSTVSVATTETGQADVVLECVIDVGSASETSKVVSRFVDNNNHWYTQYNPAAGGGQFQLFEFAAGVPISRAAVTSVGATGASRFVSIMDNEDFTAWIKDDNRLTYGAAAAGKTATLHGIGAFVGGTLSKWDKWACYKRSGYTFNV